MRRLDMRELPSRDIVVVVYPQSYLTVRHVVDYICDIILRVTGRAAKLRVVDAMEQAQPEPGSLVLVVGYKFGRFRKLDCCYVVFLNFSVMYPVRSVLRSSWAALRMMRAKRKRFQQNLSSLDAVLDFYPRHAEVLRRKVSGLPVSTFPVNVLLGRQADPPALAGCDFDVCVVGQMTRRRARIYRRLECAGVRLSPTRTDDFPEIVGRSKIVLNVRSHRYDNLEVPRIVTGLALGRAVVTEKCVGLHEVLRDDLCSQVAYDRVVGSVVSRLGNMQELAKVSRRSASYMRDEYGPACDSAWSDLLMRLNAAADAKLDRGRLASFAGDTVQGPELSSHSG